MRNITITFALLIFWGLPSLSAQDVKETSRKFMKKSTANALTVVIQGQPKNVEAVLNETFKNRTGIKGKTTKGVTAYEG